jgi:hypothetical protein
MRDHAQFLPHSAAFDIRETPGASILDVGGAREGFAAKTGLIAPLRLAVDAYLNGGGWELVGEFKDVETGKRGDRPGLEAAKALCRKCKATLVIAKLDRLSRNVHFISGEFSS